MAGGLGAIARSAAARHCRRMPGCSARTRRATSLKPMQILSVQLAASEAGVPIQRIGTVGGAALTLPGGGAISVAQLKAAHEAWLPGYMAPGLIGGAGDGDGRGGNRAADQGGSAGRAGHDRGSARRRRPLRGACRLRRVPRQEPRAAASAGVSGAWRPYGRQLHALALQTSAPED